ncbi:uncharacterized protein EpC_16950 [Erwinia pyrifoliae Ep1/96]|nr:uncharacterized protein EpC_16950 [Erwinia pyrifoliae Ep1/96]
MPYGDWGCAFFSPHALTAVVTRAMINDGETGVSAYRIRDSTPVIPTPCRNGRTNQIWPPPVAGSVCYLTVS